MKGRILQKLKENAPGFVSGARLSKMLGVSRTSVWKYVLELKKEGYVIESFTKKGYRLISVPDLLNLNELVYNLRTKKIGSSIQYIDLIDSTNTYAKKLALDGCPEGTVIVAGRQTNGKGRMGRNWDSANKSGIWMSIVLRPDILPEQAQIITLAVSVAVVKAIESLFGLKCGIKWPNDVILNGKKVCGILTEMGCETDRINYIVVGIGVNVNQDEDDFAVELKDKATSIKMSMIKENMINGDMDINRSELIKQVLFEMEKLYENICRLKVREILDEWKKYSVTIGNEVKVVCRGIEYKGFAKDITEDGGLLVNCDDGASRKVLSGEISLRGTMGYI
ncbi:MAG: biotin--[acetyl-CoA-carboxylase] ligase [Acetivibrionales bacterium]|jgi:BirA family biotin operon repressor/biotin-[acetyl-CoA-carboxylase] ligase